MDCNIRQLTTDDEPFLWEMLYQALYVPAGQNAPPHEVVRLPELSRYVQGWGLEGDCGFVASDEAGPSVGAVWLRLLRDEYRGYGYVDDNTPELSIAVFPEYRGQGIGTLLLTHLFSTACGHSSVSLSVSASNPARHLYERFGFIVISQNGTSITMKRDT